VVSVSIKSTYFGNPGVFLLLVIGLLLRTRVWQRRNIL
jgi:hypothetical protein